MTNMEATNWEHMLQLSEPVVYEEHTVFMLLHFRKEDIPNWSLNSATKYLGDIYKFLAFVHQVFVCYSKKSDVFMLQLESFIPSMEKEQRAKVSPGVIFIFSFAYTDLEQENFEVACRAAMAVANGYLHESDVYGHEDWAALRKSMEPFDSVRGLWNAPKMRPKAVKEGLPTIKTERSLDTIINQYVMHHESEESSMRDWMDRFNAFNENALFKRLPRLNDLYVQLSHYAAWKNKETLPGAPEANYKYIDKASGELREKGTPDVVLDRFMKLFKWRVVDNSGEGTALDLSDYIAWEIHPAHIEEDKSFFFRHRFYEMTMSDTLLRRGLQMRNKRPWSQDGEEDRKVKRVAYNTAMDHRQINRSLTDTSDFELLYPLLSVAKEICSGLASDKGEDVTSYFTQEKNSEFMLLCVDSAMRSCKNGGVARKKQYLCMEALQEYFIAGHLNSINGDKTPPLCIHRTAGVEPSQDIMVQHLYRMIKVNGIRQLGVEFCMMLMANIISFTTTNNKPMIAINGPPGAGKSHTAKAVGRIAIGTDDCWNNSAFEAQDYFTIKSMAAAREDPYERVFGTSFLEEWRSSSNGSENVYAKDTTMEATTLKNIWDKGIVVNERCMKKEKTDQIMSEKQTSLFSRSFIILANGLNLASSLEDRFLVYHVPDLKEDPPYVDEERSKEVLTESGHIQLFSFMRFHISEGINRRAIGLTVKEKKVHMDLDEYEAKLTFDRMNQVLTNMALKTLDSRKIKQVRLLADVIARYRAVMEVLGYSHGSQANTIEEDRMRLESMTDCEKALMMEMRTILDPADIISAATMVIKFSDLHTKVLSDIVKHLIDPNIVQFLDHSYYIRLDTTMRSMYNELKDCKCGVLLQTLTETLDALECRKTEGTIPVPVVRKIQNNTCRERFDLYIEAETAALSYCESRPDLVQKSEEFMVQTILQSVNGVTFNVRDVAPGLLRVHDDHLVFCVPQDLVRTFSFFRHIPHSGAAHIDGKTFKVHADFGKLRVKVAKALLQKHLEAAGTEDVHADKDGYFTIHLANCLKPLFALPKVPTVEVKSGQPLIDGERVHLMGMNNEGLCRKMMPNLATVKQGYVTVDAALETYGQVPIVEETNVPAFILDTANKMKVHALVLDEMPMLHGQHATQESRAQNFVKRMLCKHMTAMPSILCFDRETCYETQKPEDTFHFVHVPPQDELPEFWDEKMPCQNYGVNKKVANKKYTFSPNHKEIKLAYKQSIMAGHIRELRAQHPSERRADGSHILDTGHFLRERKRVVMNEEVKRFTPIQDEALLPYPLSMVRLVQNC